MVKLKVVVLMGGESSEREVSLMTGGEVVKNLDRSKYEVKSCEMGDKGWVEKVKGSDIVFIAMHGAFGEDGKIQGFLESLGKKYTGSGVRASVIGIDKLLFRRVVEGEVLMSRLVRGPPCVVKPVDQGSSVGVSIVKEKKDLKKAIALAKKYSDRLMMEEYMRGTEVSCGILGGKALPVVEICPKHEFFDYGAKYTPGECEEIVPARIGKKLTTRVQKLAEKIYKLVGCRGMARIDMIIKGDKIYVLEINTIPGLTENSLLPKEALAAGISYPELLDKIIKLGLEK